MLFDLPMNLALWGLLFSPSLALVATRASNNTGAVCDAFCSSGSLCDNNAVVTPTVSPHCGDRKCMDDQHIVSTMLPAATAKAKIGRRDGELQKRNRYGPEAYGGDANEFMVAQVYQAYQQGNLVPHRRTGKLSSAVTRTFRKSPLTIAVQKLHGCTTLVTVSRTGAFVSHHWEAPSFKSWDSFRSQVIDPLWEEEGSSQNPALAPLAGRGQRFSQSQGARSFIVTSFDRFDRTHLQFADKIASLKRNVERMLSNAQVQVVGYHPLWDGDQDPALTDSAHGKISVQYDPEDTWFVDRRFPGQYMQQASWTVWVEGNKVAKDTWRALEFQRLPPPRPRRGGH
jgi:hypothetical protein